MAPAARCTSLHISLSEAAATPAYTANSRNCTSSPPLILSASTWCAPNHSTSVMAATTSVVESAVSQARTRVRTTATSNEASTASP